MGEVLLPRGTTWVTSNDRRPTLLSIILWNFLGVLLNCICCFFSILPLWNSVLILLALVGSPPLRLARLFTFTCLCTRPLATPGNIRGTYEGG